MRSVHFVTLGCASNSVDTAAMQGQLQAMGHTAEADASRAQLIVVNTCGFIGAASEASIDAILQMATHKQTGACERLVVAGCLGERFGAELQAALPEVDAVLGTGASLAGLAGLPALAPSSEGATPICQASPGSTRRLPIVSDWAPAPERQPAPASASLRAVEGCSHACAFCVVPTLRGPAASVPIEALVAEAERLVARGVTELNVAAQDLCAYGADAGAGPQLVALLRALDAVGQRARRRIWVRPHALHPAGLSDAILDAIAELEHVVPWIDLPLQHIADRLLLRMRRGLGERGTRALLDRIDARVPGASLRGTLIAGLPGETEAHFDALAELVASGRFAQLRVFAYAREDGTPAARMPGQVPAEVAEGRVRHLLALQRKVTLEQNRARVGQRIEVLVEGRSPETDLLLQGRHAGQGPGHGGATHITGTSAARPPRPGTLATIEVAEASATDIAGAMVAPDEQPAQAPRRRAEARGSR